MKVYCFGEKEKPVIFLFPGTCCHWKGNFRKNLADISVPLMAVHWAVLLSDCLQHAEISIWSMVF